MSERIAFKRKIRGEMPQQAARFLTIRARLIIIKRYIAELG